jgi:hypothetical protein
MARGEYVFETGENRQAVGGGVEYHTDKNTGSKMFNANAYYNKTFNSGNTNLSVNGGYSSTSSDGFRQNTLYTNAGIEHNVSKDTMLFGGAGVAKNQSGTSFGIEAGVEQRINNRFTAFGKVGYGSSDAMGGHDYNIDGFQNFNKGNVTVGVKIGLGRNRKK